MAAYIWDLDGTLLDSYGVIVEGAKKTAAEAGLREQAGEESQVWNRSIDSLKREWAAHNAFHAMGIFRSRTGHMDLNWPQPWFVRLGYAILGRVVWPFIK